MFPYGNATNEGSVKNASAGNEAAAGVLKRNFVFHVPVIRTIYQKGQHSTGSC